MFKKNKFPEPKTFDVLKDTKNLRHSSGLVFSGFQVNSNISKETFLHRVDISIPYGVRIISKEVLLKNVFVESPRISITIGNTYYLELETMHKRKFIVFYFDGCIGVIPFVSKETIWNKIKKLLKF